MELRRLRILALLFGSSIHFLRYAKYVSTISLYLHRPAKIYVKSNLRQSSIMSVCELLYYVFCSQRVCLCVPYTYPDLTTIIFL